MPAVLSPPRTLDPSPSRPDTSLGLNDLQRLPFDQPQFGLIGLKLFLLLMSRDVHRFDTGEVLGNHAVDHRLDRFFRFGDVPLLTLHRRCESRTSSSFHSCRDFRFFDQIDRFPTPAQPIQSPSAQLALPERQQEPPAREFKIGLPTFSNGFKSIG
ncbi:BQ5605_C004g03026 [Microbotryum silenes-dioicae]|uniref:BQ5605_C004g03026 protein n=1 Tax=Microbotryum silenes-dioicae TaxID=796604 RepID=A0A2X0PBI0_9BASI|nr:BQ5605_C004g03026 [Microbotryum silenes-dioicae]